MISWMIAKLLMLFLQSSQRGRTILEITWSTSILFNIQLYIFLILTSFFWIHFIPKHSTNDSGIIEWKTPAGNCSPVSVQTEFQCSFIAVRAFDQSCTAMHTAICWKSFTIKSTENVKHYNIEWRREKGNLDLVRRLVMITFINCFSTRLLFLARLHLDNVWQRVSIFQACMTCATIRQYCES